MKKSIMILIVCLVNFYKINTGQKMSQSKKEDCVKRCYVLHESRPAKQFKEDVRNNLLMLNKCLKPCMKKFKISAY